jgi:hypothetical protein
MSAEDDTRRILTQLATLAEAVSGIRSDGARRDAAFEQERMESHQSRSDLHEKVNAAVADIASLRSDVRVNSSIAALNGQDLKKLQDTVEANAKAVAPTVEQFDQVKNLGKVILYLIGAGGIGVASGFLFWGDALRGAISHWLGVK